MEQPTKLTVHGPAPTIGFLVDWLEHSYQWAVLRGVADAARDRGAHLLCFVGGILDAPDRGEARRNGVFELASLESVDALVILAGTMGNHVGPERLLEYCERYRPLPMCSIAVELPQMSSVCVDNEAGVQKAVHHLARVHGRQRIAFVRGPSANAEAERRFHAYREAIAENGFPFDPALVALGDFEPEGGRDAVRLFLTERKLLVDAIVTANDSMALGALKELDRLGIRVPDQIALLGFDDIDEVRFSTPPLTTVRQPQYEQGREAVRLVLDQLQLGTGVERLVRPTELITRRSCGCIGPSSDSAASGPLPSGRLGFEATLVERRELVLAHLSRAARGAFSAAGAGWEVRLVNAFASQLRDDTSTAFIEAYDDLLRRLSKSGVELSICNDVLSTLRRQMLACLSADAARQLQAEDMFHEARVLTSNAMERAQAWERMHVQQRARGIGRAGSMMITAANLDDLSRAAAASLPNLGIDRFYVSLFERGQGRSEPKGERLCRLILAHEPRHEEAASIQRPQAPYRSVEILPRGVLPSGREHAFVVAPLFLGDDDLGIAVMELGAADGSVYESVRELFSVALWRAQMIDDFMGSGNSRAG